MAYQEGITTADQMVTPSTDARLETKYMLDTMDEDAELHPLADLFRRAGMEGYLRGPDLLTLFAPRADALSGIDADDPDKISALLRTHMLGRAVTEDELRTATAVESLERTEIPIAREGAETRVGGARIVRADIECTNGVIHVIDGLIRS
jgi:uncharacterized surface protein with fasciclin (FAS1) repeats